MNAYNNLLFKPFLCIGFVCLFVACDLTRPHKDGEHIGNTVLEKPQEVKKTIHYNLYIENSGSMKGYCNINNQSSIEALVSDYYERLKSSDNTNQVTLNFINTEIEPSNKSKIQFLQSIRTKCTAQYTKIDQMLEMMMQNTNDSTVNLLISDYVFSTNQGGITIASHGITSLVQRELNKRDFAVAMSKYLVNFKGRYYPGGIQCNKELPLYVWVFGKKENVRKVIGLPFEYKDCGEFFIQEPSYPNIELKAKSKRFVEGNKLHISQWNRNNKGVYEFKLTVSLSDVLLDELDITNPSNYNISAKSSSVYTINDIEKIDEDKYTFSIHTNKPSPGDITISYPISMPDWVEDSNFEGIGLPDDGTTLGVKYLINAVDKAFKDAAGPDKYNYFELKIKTE